MATTERQLDIILSLGIVFILIGGFFIAFDISLIYIFLKIFFWKHYDTISFFMIGAILIGYYVIRTRKKIEKIKIRINSKP